MKFLIMLLLIGLAGSACAAEVYRWQDAQGVIRYSDTMPPPTAKNVQKFKSTGGSLILEKPVPPVQDSAEVAEKSAKAIDQPAEKPEITLFSFDECGAACKEAEGFLNKRGVPFTLKNQELDKTELQQRTGKLEVPVIFIGKEMRSGFQEKVWNELLDATGYGKGKLDAKPAPAASSVKASPKNSPP
jgi:glutaredoxin